VLQNIVTTVYIKVSINTVVSNIVWPQYIKWCNYLRSVQHAKYQNVSRSYVVIVFPVLSSLKLIAVLKLEILTLKQEIKFRIVFLRTWILYVFIFVTYEY
jgi:hypothetical protein